MLRPPPWSFFSRPWSICGIIVSREIAPEPWRALALKPKAEDFI